MGACCSPAGTALWCWGNLDRTDTALADLPEGLVYAGFSWCAGMGDVDAVRELVETVGSELAQLFLYPGDRAPVRRQLAAVVPRGRGGPGRAALAGVPRPGGLSPESDDARGQATKMQNGWPEGSART